MELQVVSRKSGLFMICHLLKSTPMILILRAMEASIYGRSNLFTDGNKSSHIDLFAARSMNCERCTNVLCEDMKKGISIDIYRPEIRGVDDFCTSFITYFYQEWH